VRPVGLEGRELLSRFAGPGGLRERVPAVEATPEYYAQPVPVANPGVDDPSPIWDEARVYQCGPAPEEQVWVIVPAVPSGKLDLIVHSGGFESGSPTSGEIDGLAERDLGQGMTVASVGYRTLATSSWPAPVEDIAEGIDAGTEVAQGLAGVPITDVTETGLSAGGTALALINYSTAFPSTATRPDRIITISAPLEAGAVPPGAFPRGVPVGKVLRWNLPPKSDVPITLMGTQGDPVALERGRASTVRLFTHYLAAHGVPVETYLNPHDPGQHGRTAEDFQIYPDVAAALQRAYDFGG
jgi:acetyl esterase/lipase